MPILVNGCRMKAKYVIIEHEGCEVVIVFSPLLSHQDVARYGDVQSAGFCKLNEDGRWAVSGESVSLNQRAKARDANILNAFLPVGGGVLAPTALAD